MLLYAHLNCFCGSWQYISGDIDVAIIFLSKEFLYAFLLLFLFSFFFFTTVRF